MACIVDGAKMDFMETMDVYALFTGLFEDTFYSIKMLEEPDKNHFATICLWAERDGARAGMDKYEFQEGESL